MSIAGNQFFTGIVNKPTTVPDLFVNRLTTTQITSGGPVIVTGKLATTMNTITLSATSNTIQVTSNVMSVSALGAVTIATIQGGISGQILTLIFSDTNVTITDSSPGTLNQILLSAAFISAVNTVLTLVYNGTKWFEVSRSVNG